MVAVPSILKSHKSEKAKEPKEPKEPKAADEAEKDSDKPTEETAASGTAALKDLTGDPFSGHLGHLSAAQEASLDEFRKALAADSLYTAASESAPASHDDSTLLRFLRARRFSVPDAVKQFKDTEAWRKANALSELYQTIEVADYDETRKLYPTWTGRRDRRGYPIYIFEVGKLPAQMAAYNKSLEKAGTPKKGGDGKTPAKLLRLFALYDNMTEFVLPLCTQLSKGREDGDLNTPVTQSNNVVDIRNVSLMQFWNLKSHMQDASTLATAHYPETLDRVFIIGAPSFFPTVWGWIKRWFDPVTVNKIFILSASEVTPVLSSFIDPKNIPTRYGGSLEYEFGDMPMLDEALDESIEWLGEHKGFPRGPARWVRKSDEVWEMEAVGSVDGKQRGEVVARFRTRKGRGEANGTNGVDPALAKEIA